MTPPPAGDAAIRTGSKSFAMASRLFDPATRALVWDLYRWCRHCDDVTDGQTLGHGASHDARLATPEARLADHDARLASLEAGTAAAYAGTAPDDDPFGALARVVAATGLPRRLADDHLAGFAMDTAGRRYATIDDTLDYCYHVAGVVGLMMAWVMGVRDREVLCRASDLGLAFQLSNIARDVGDDLANGRLYLPESWLRDANATAAPGAPLTAPLAASLDPVVARAIALAERYYDAAWYGVPFLPGRSAWAVATARLVYRDIGRQVTRRGAAAWTSRTVVSTPRKITRLLQAGVQVGLLRATPPWGRAPARAGLYTPSSVAMLG